MPGEGAKHMEDSRDRHKASHQDEKSKHFCPLRLHIRATQEDTAAWHWMEQCSHSCGEEAEQGSLEPWSVTRG